MCGSRNARRDRLDALQPDFPPHERHAPGAPEIPVAGRSIEQDRIGHMAELAGLLVHDRVDSLHDRHPVAALSVHLATERETLVLAPSIQRAKDLVHAPDFDHLTGLESEDGLIRGGAGRDPAGSP